jgi:hypothetical protein
MGLIKRAKTGVGRGIQIIGMVLWAVGGLVALIWALYALFSYFGWWAVFVGLCLTPITYFASILIVWFTTGIFPVVLLIPYIASWVGMGLGVIGGIISGEE